MIFMFCDLHFFSKITPCLWIKINEFASFDFGFARRHMQLSEL